MMKLPLNVDFTGKVVVVTGAGGVLCGEMARAYAQAGAKVASLDLNEEAVKKLADELTAEGFICKGYKANVLDAEALEAVHQQVLADLARATSSSTALAAITRARRPTTSTSTKPRKGRRRSSTLSPTAWTSCSS